VLSFTGTEPCPDWEKAKAVSVVNIEHPIFVTIGFSLVVLGFILQCFAFPGPKPIAQLRADLKAAKLKERS
jgi:hypothetical protein